MIEEFWSQHRGWSIVIIFVVGIFTVLVPLVQVTIASGWFPKDKKLYAYILASSNDIGVSERDGVPCHLNTRQTHISYYFVKFPCKWYVNNLGPVPRWYKSHKLIQKIWKAKGGDIRRARRNKDYSDAFGMKIP